jgi:hypothetical protein
MNEMHGKEKPCDNFFKLDTQGDKVVLSPKEKRIKLLRKRQLSCLFPQGGRELLSPQEGTKLLSPKGERD